MVHAHAARLYETKEFNGKRIRYIWSFIGVGCKKPVGEAPVIKVPPSLTKRNTHVQKKVSSLREWGLNGRNPEKERRKTTKPNGQHRLVSKPSLLSKDDCSTSVQLPVRLPYLQQHARLRLRLIRKRRKSRKKNGTKTKLPTPPRCKTITLLEYNGSTTAQPQIHSNSLIFSHEWDWGRVSSEDQKCVCSCETRLQREQREQQSSGASERT